MLLRSDQPFTNQEIASAAEQFEVYIKTVIDIKRKICTAGMDRHFEGEQVLMAEGSNQSDLWGGGIDLETLEIDYNSFINIRPRDNNSKNEIQSDEIKNIYRELTEYFFSELFSKQHA